MPFLRFLLNGAIRRRGCDRRSSCCCCRSSCRPRFICASRRSCFIFALAVVGLNLLMGFAGQVSLGHAGFFGIGAYAVAVGPTHLGIPSWAALLIGAALAGLLAFAIGRPILKLKGHYLAVATLGMGLLIGMVLTNEARWTGGPDGMPVARLVLFGWTARGTVDLVLDFRRDADARRAARGQPDRKPDRAGASAPSMTARPHRPCSASMSRATS